MLFFYNLSLVSLIYRAPTGEPKWGEGRNFFSLSIPVRKFLEGGPLPEVETLKGDPPWPGIWQKETSTSGYMVSEFLGRGLQNLPRLVQSLAGEASEVSHEGPGHGGLTSPNVTPARPLHRAGPLCLVIFLKAQILCYVHTKHSFLLNGPLIFLIFKIIRKSSKGVPKLHPNRQFHLFPKLCIYVYFHPQ